MTEAQQSKIALAKKQFTRGLLSIEEVELLLLSEWIPQEEVSKILVSLEETSD